MMKTLGTVALLVSLAAPLEAADWPQWRGPDRSGVSSEDGLLKEWPDGGPRKVWTFGEAGLGYSSFAVVGDTLYTMGALGEGEEPESESVFALDTRDGSLKWSTEVGPYLNNGWGGGPRATPTFDQGQLFAMSGTGHLVCLDAADGKLLWKVEMVADLGGKRPNWGYCESVLVDENRVICTPGGKEGPVVALDRNSGKVLWRADGFDDKAQYSSPITIEYAGKKQYVQLLQGTLVGLDPSTGETLWSSEWPGRTAVIPTPVYDAGKIFITSGYGVGCKLVDLGGGEPSEVYFNKNMKNHHGGVIKIGPHIYGYSDGRGWVCLEFDTGEVVWGEKRALGKGAITAADGMLICLDERDGTVVLAEASPDGWNERGRFELAPQSERRSPRGRIWTHPVIANGRLYLRDQEFISAYDIAQ